MKHTAHLLIAAFVITNSSPTHASETQASLNKHFSTAIAKERLVAARKLMNTKPINVNALNKDIDETPLMTAVRKNCSSAFIQELIDYGADPFMQNAHGKTASDYMSKKTSLEVRELLSSLIEAATKNDISTLETFVYCGHDINKPEKDGYTPLMAAANHRNKKALEYILSIEGLNINAQTDEEYTALDYAYPNKKIVALLRNKGAKNRANLVEDEIKINLDKIHIGLDALEKLSNGSISMSIDTYRSKSKKNIFLS